VGGASHAQGYARILTLLKRILVQWSTSNRPVAANRAEETRGPWAVAEWDAAPLKTDQSMVPAARDLARSWETLSTLVNRPGGSQPLGRYPFWRVNKTTYRCGAAFLDE
jgi:hypothetical protein